MTLRSGFFALKPGIVFAAAILTVLGFVLLTCENTVSLGGTVDVDSPKISVTEPSSGEFLKGTRTFKGTATDDKGLEYVTISFQGIVTGEDGGSNLSSTGYIPVQSYDAASGVWTFTLDTTAYADGELTVQLKVSDSVNEIETPKLSYTIKNSPTTLELASPGPYTAADIDRLSREFEDKPGGDLGIRLLNSLDFVATASDRQGVAPGYPKIKFWPVADPANAAAWDAAKPADWSAFDDYGTSGWTEGNPIWAERKNPYVPSTYHLAERGIGYYRFQLLVKDVSGAEQYFPSADRAGWLQITTVSDPPEIVVTSPATEVSYESGTLIFSATASHASGINTELDKVKGTDGGIVLRYTGPDRAAQAIIPTEGNPVITSMDAGSVRAGYTINLGEQTSPGVFKYPEGTYKFTFTVKNREGGEASTFVSVIIDRSPPKPAVNLVDPELRVFNASYSQAYFGNTTSTGDYVNGKITIHGLTTDTYGIKTQKIKTGGVEKEIDSVKWIIQDSAISGGTDLKALYDSIDVGVLSDGSYSFADDNALKASRFFVDSREFDTTAPALFPNQPGTYYFYLLAVDNAGNAGISAGRILKVNQETDKPVIIFTDFNTAVKNMDESGSPNYDYSILHPNNNTRNLLSDNAAIRGSIEEDDGLFDDDINFYIWELNPDTFDFNNNLVSHTADLSTANYLISKSKSEVSGLKTVNLQENFSAHGLGDGVYALRVTLRDNNSPPVGNSYGPFVFGIDKLAPDISVSMPAKARDFVKHNFEMKGIVTTSTGVKSLKITPPAGSVPSSYTLNYPADFTASGNNYGWTQSLSIAADGAQSIMLEATDKFGKTSTRTFEVIRDNEKPVISINTPKSYYSGTTDSISGTAEDYIQSSHTSDNFGEVSKVLYWTGPAATLPSAILPSGINNSNLGSDNPGIPGFGLLPAEGDVLAAWLTGHDGSVDGISNTARPELQSAAAAGRIHFGTNPLWKTAGGTTNWIAPIDLTGLKEGEKIIYALALDAAGNYSLNSSGGAFAFYDAAGNRQKQSFMVDQNDPELTKLYLSKARLKGNRDAANDTAFIPDPAADSLHIQRGNGASDGYSGFSFTGTVTESNALLNRTSPSADADFPLVLVQSRKASSASAFDAGKAYIRIPYSSITDNLDGTYSFTVDNLPRDPSNPAVYYDRDGMYSYEIILRDAADKTNNPKTTRVVYADNTGPALAITRPALFGGIYPAFTFDSVNSTTLDIGGTASDNLSQIAGIYWKVTNNPAAPAAPADLPSFNSGGAVDLNGWAKLNMSSASWAGQITTPVIAGEGARYLYMMALDESGNFGSIPLDHIQTAAGPVYSDTGRRFDLDTASPTIEIVDMRNARAMGANNSVYAAKNFEIDIKVHDSNALPGIDASTSSVVNGADVTAAGTDWLSIKLKKTGGGETLIPNGDITLKSKDFNNGAELVLTIRKTVDASTHADDGTYTFSFKVKDIVNKITNPVLTQVVTVDTLSPSVEVTRFDTLVSANARGNNVNGFIDFRVSASDESSIDELRWWLLPKNSTPTWASSALTGNISSADTEIDEAVHTIASGLNNGKKYTGGKKIAAELPATISVNTRDLSDNSEYELFIYATDLPGNRGALDSGSSYKLVYVDQSTDLPVLAINAPSEDGYQANGNISARVTDDDGFAAAGAVQIRYRSVPDPYDGTSGWSGWENAAYSGGAYEIQINHPVASSALGGDANNGPKEIQIRVKDDENRKRGGDPAVSIGDPEGTFGGAAWSPPAAITRAFKLDTKPPLVKINAKGSSAYDGVTEKNLITVRDLKYLDTVPDPDVLKSFVLRGQVREKYLKELKITLDNNIVQYEKNIPPANIVRNDPAPSWDGETYDWHFDFADFHADFNAFNADTFAEGNHSVSVDAADYLTAGAGVMTGGAKQMSFVYDRSAPGISFLNLGSSGGLTVTLSNADLADMATYTPGELAGMPAKADLVSRIAALGGSALKSNPAVQASLSDTYSPIAGTIYYLLDSDFEEWIRAQAKLSHPEYVPGTDKDHGPIDWNVVPPVATAIPNKSDWQQVSSTGSNTFASIRIDIPGPLDTPRHLYDGIHRLWVWAEDSLGNESLFQDIAFMVDRNDPEVIFTTAAGASYTDVYASAATDVILKIEGFAKDANLSSVKYHFDSSPAEYEAASVASKSDSNYINDVVDSGVPTRESQWKIEVTRQMFNTVPLNTDGPHTISFVARDASGNESQTYSWTFTKDTAKPLISLNNTPDETVGLVVLLDSSPKLRGTAADDNSKVEKLETRIQHYKWDPASLAADAKGYIWEDVQDWTAIGGLKPGSTIGWEKAMGPGSGLYLPGSGPAEIAANAGLPDGKYRILIRAADSALPDAANTGTAGGNIKYYDDASSDANALVFLIDRYSPAKLVINESNLFQKGSFRLEGSVEEWNEVTITGSVSGGSGITAVNMPFTVPAANITRLDAYRYTWRVDIPVDPDRFDSSIPDASKKLWAQISYTVRIDVTDLALKTGSSTRDFTYDKDPASGGVSSPLPTTYMNGQVSISGNSSDKNGITKIYYYYGKTTADGNVDIALENPLLLKAPDDPDPGAKRWIDTALEDATPFSNSQGFWAGGLYTWNYTFVNISQFAPLTVTPGNFYTIPSGMVYPFDRSEKPDTSGGTPVTLYSYTWKLPFYVKIVDVAGNEKIISYIALMDPDADNPNVIITSPQNNQILGGKVTVMGTADDDDWMYGVKIRVSYLDDDGVTLKFLAPQNPGSVANHNELTQNWSWTILTSSPGKNITWQYIINADNSLDPALNRPPRKVWIETQAVDTQNDPILHVDDRPFRAGSVLKMDISLDSTVPKIYDQKLVRIINGAEESVNLSSNTSVYAAGRFVIRTTIRDESGIKKIEARESTVGSSVALGELAPSASGRGFFPPTTKSPASGAFIANRRYYIVKMGSYSSQMWKDLDIATPDGPTLYEPGVTFTYNGTAAITPDSGAKVYEATLDTTTTPPSQYFDFEVQYPVDTIGSGYFPLGKTGEYSLFLRAYDNTTPNPYAVENTINIKVDNSFPYMSNLTPLNASTDNFLIEGAAWDMAKGTEPASGSVEALKQVVLYFERNGYYIMPNGTQIQPGANPNTLMTTLANVIDLGDASGSGFNSATHYNGAVHKTPGILSHYPKLTGSVSSSQGIVIDNTEASSDTDGDGYVERWEWMQNAASQVWAVYYKSYSYRNTLGDGPLTVHYVVLDKAGNATHFSQGLYIRNNPPIIWNLDLSTDLDNNGSTGSLPDETLSGWTIAALKTGSALIGADNDRYTFNGSTQKPPFVVRNSMLKFDISTIDCNGALTYRVSHVKANTTPVSPDSASWTIGNVYTIKTPGDTNWVALGAPNNNTGATFVAAAGAEPFGGGSGLSHGDATIWDTVIFRQNSSSITGASFDGKVSKVGSASFSGTGDFHTGAGTDQAKINDTITGNRTLNDLPAADRNSSLFLIKVYDSTVGGGGAAEADQLAFVTIVGLDIDNVDETPPRAAVKPFYWNNKDDNSLYLNSRNNGHIELEADLGPAFGNTGGLLDRDPKVSGTISIRGTTSDNNMIKYLYVYMDTYPFAGQGNTPIYTRNYKLGATYNAGTWTPVDQMSTNGWKFSAVNVKHDQSGHEALWQLDIDTARIPNVASLDKTFRIVARDSNPNDSANPETGSNNNQTVAAALTPSYRMDIVPYITKIQTQVRNEGGLKDNNIRSAEGKYSIIQGTNNAFITVTGFNFNGAARILTGSQKDTAANYTNNAAGSVLVSTVGSTSRITASNNSTHSGYLTVYSGTGGAWIGSLNNINNNDSAGTYAPASGGNGLNEENMPNREADPYTTKNIRLSDDRYLQFYTVKKTDVKNGYYPVMLMNGSNPVFAYLDLTGGPSGNPVAGAGGGAGTYYPSHAMPQRAEFNLNSAVANYKEYLIKASIWDSMGMARDDSGRYIHATTYNRDGATLHLIYDRYAELYTNAGNGWGSGTGYNGYRGNWAHDNTNNAIALETVNLNGLLLDRYQYPKLIARGNSTSTAGAAYYMTYYDDGTGHLIFRNFRIGSNAGAVGISSGRLSNTGSDAAGRNYGQPHTSITENPNGNSSWATGRLTVAGNAAGEDPSKHFDMAVSSANIVVIAYYDEADGQLKIKYSPSALTGTNPASRIAWKDSPVDLPYYTGTYVSMVMDAANGIHIAAFDAVDSDLKYIYIPNYEAASYTATTVDQYGAVGNWTQIKLKNNVPYIAYYNATETGGRDTIKLAWAGNAVTSMADVKGGVDAGGYTTGEWEYMTVPAIDPPQGGSTKFQKVNLDFTADGRPVLGYLATYIEFSYPVGE